MRKLSTNRNSALNIYTKQFNTICTITNNFVVTSRKGQVMPPPQAADSKGQQSWQQKKINSLRSTLPKLLRKITGIPISNCDFCQFIISVMSGHCKCSPRARRPRSYATGHLHHPGGKKEIKKEKKTKKETIIIQSASTSRKTKK